MSRLDSENVGLFGCKQDVIPRFIRGELCYHVWTAKWGIILPLVAMPRFIVGRGILKRMDNKFNTNHIKKSTYRVTTINIALSI